MAKTKISIITLVSILVVAILIGIFLLANAKSSSEKISFKNAESSPEEISFEDEDEDMDEFRITGIKRSITANIIENGCIRDEQSAAEIAAAIFKSVFGENSDYDLPLIVDFDEKEQNWLIMTQLPKNMLGGSLYIIIKKSNAEVVAIWGTK